MKKLKDLTPEIREKIQVYKDKCRNDLYNGQEYAKYDKKNTIAYIEYIYNMIGRKLPIVVVVNSIREYKLKYNQLFNSDMYNIKINSLYILKNNLFKDEKEKLFLESKVKEKVEIKPIKEMVIAKKHWLFLTSEYSRVYLTWYKFIKDEFKLKTKKANDLDWLYENVNASSIAKVFLTEKVVLVLRMPQRIMRNEVGFHCASYDGAIQYKNEKYHFLNGRKVPDWIFDKYFSKELKLEDFTSCKNEEDKGSIITLIKENEGNEGVLKFLDAKLVDEKTFIHKDGYNDIQRLYKSKNKFTFAKDSNGKSNVNLAWHEMICASTKQSYLIETCPTFKNVEDSAKFLRPKSVPTSVPYLWQSCN